MIFKVLAVLLFALPAFAKDAHKPARTWKTLVEHVMKNGDDDPIEGSTAKTLGYGGDAPAKSLGIDENKSKDKREHGIYVVFDKATAAPKDIVLGAIAVKETPAGKDIDSWRVRLSLDGKIISGMHATGLVGRVVQEPLGKDSKALQSVFKAESALYLKNIELSELTK